MTPEEREVMELALEALESYEKSAYIKQSHPKRWANGNKAITTIKEALAQPAVAEQHKQSTTCGEPVAVVVQVQHPAAVALKLKADVPVGTTLYTTPPYVATPRQRTWVGLTDYQIEMTWFKHHDAEGYLRNPNQEGWAYEKELMDKLKEKNT